MIGKLLTAVALSFVILPGVPPSEFIPAAEESGLILSIGTWVLLQAIRQAVKWMEIGRPLVIAVNISAAQFRQPDLPRMISDILHEEGLPAAYLELELTSRRQLP